MNALTQDQEYLKRLTLLYVEDEEDTRKQFTLFFSRLTGRVITAINGAEGLDAYHTQMPDIIITDIQMPVMDGLKMVQEIRTSNRSIPIILLTAFEQPEYLTKSINIGVDNYVTKPVDSLKLQAALLRTAHRLLAEEKLAEQNRLEKESLLKSVEVAEQEKLAANAASHAMSTFLATMSHEIRTPLNAILGMNDLLAETSLDSAQLEYLTIARSASETLLRLIDDILDLSKIEAEKLKLDTAPFWLSEVVNEVMGMLSVRAFQKKISLESSLSNRVPDWISGDSYRLGQVLINLLGNAIKFTEAGSVSMRVDFVSTSGNEVVLKFSVTDSGIGIPSDKLLTIFDNFTQADSSTTRNYGGSGLGLAISRRLVEMMGGELCVESTPGQGSCFYFTSRFAIPLEIPEEALPTVAEAKPGRNLSVLLVDDNKDNRTVLCAYFRKTGHSVETAVNGEEGVAKIRQGNYDLVLMDMEMPVMDGYTAVSLIREWEMETGKTPLPIIALTANALKEDQQRSLDAGCTAHLTKPIHKEKLLEVVGEYAGV